MDVGDLSGLPGIVLWKPGGDFDVSIIGSGKTTEPSIRFKMSKDVGFDRLEDVIRLGIIDSKPCLRTEDSVGKAVTELLMLDGQPSSLVIRDKTGKVIFSAP
jgi:hypothetical protein